MASEAHWRTESISRFISSMFGSINSPRKSCESQCAATSEVSWHAVDEAYPTNPNRGSSGGRMWR
jgi:hypothetical protein